MTYRKSSKEVNLKNYLFTSESVSEGHPDKMADQISDGILDAILAQDPKGRVACETLLTTGLVVIGGEISTSAKVNMSEVARNVIKNIGYDHSDKGFDYKTCGVMVAVGQQSPDISMGVKETLSADQGAGDQGLMFGYAVNETPEMMPLSIAMSHKLVRELATLRKANKVNWLRPDAKSQVTVQYVDGVAKRIDTIVISTQHSEDVKQETIKDFVLNELIKKHIPSQWIDNNTKFHINPTGRFVTGGPMGDAGLTGRKIIVDTYGGHGAHGGGAFSGKDPSKVDRSAAYAARHIAKHVVAAGLAQRCLLQVASLNLSASRSMISARARSDTRSSKKPFANFGICGLRASPKNSICSARSMAQPPRTVTSAAAKKVSRGRS
jgi:S-adenosylmethionine synthetase